MIYSIIVKGPAGIGKSSIAKKLAKILNGYYFSFDKIMEKHKLDTIVGDGIPAENFVKANLLIIPKAEENLKNDRIVVLDGCFYRKMQLDHLEKNLPYKKYIFSVNHPPMNGRA